MPEPHFIEKLIEEGHLLAAAHLLLARLGQNPADVNLLRASHQLSARLRSHCMDLACNKATDGSAEAVECEDLLRKVIAFNGEGIYG